MVEKNLLNGCANITGGGIEDNIKRVDWDEIFKENLVRVD